MFPLDEIRFPSISNVLIFAHMEYNCDYFLRAI